MICKRIITVLTIFEGVLYRTKLFKPDYRYSANFVDSWSVDEIIILDITRKISHRTKEKFRNFFLSFAKNCFVPLTVGGWIRNLNDAKKLFEIGADKIVLNTGALIDPKLIKQVANNYGSQSIVLSIDVLEQEGKYFLYSHQGKIKSSLDPFIWAKKAEDLGVGEILITSINRDGWLQGFDTLLCEKMKTSVNVPVLALGGCGNWKHIKDLFVKSNVDGVCTQNIYHFTETSISSAKNFLFKNGIKVRI